MKGKNLKPFVLLRQACWWLAMLRSASAVAAAVSFVWWFVARCPQTAASHWNQSSSNRLAGLLLPSVSLAFPGRCKPSDGKSSRAASERARTNTPHKTHTDSLSVCQIPQSSKGNQGQMREASEWWRAACRRSWSYYKVPQQHSEEFACFIFICCPCQNLDERNRYATHVLVRRKL